MRIPTYEYNHINIVTKVEIKVQYNTHLQYTFIYVLIVFRRVKQIPSYTILYVNISSVITMVPVSSAL